MRRYICTLLVFAPVVAFAQTDQQSHPNGGYSHNFERRFEAANTTHDGHLTLAQAQAAGLHMLVKHFSDIDTQNKGYVTVDDIKAWRKAHHHSHPPASGN